MPAAVADQCIDPLFDERLQNGDSLSCYFQSQTEITL